MNASVDVFRIINPRIVCMKFYQFLLGSFYSEINVSVFFLAVTVVLKTVID